MHKPSVKKKAKDFLKQRNYTKSRFLNQKQ